MRDEKSDKIKTDLQLYPENAGAGPWLVPRFPIACLRFLLRWYEKSNKIKTDLQLYPENAGAGP